jgi:putative addiction module CopG family antidote
MQVQVDPKWRPFIEAKVASGEFASADAVVDAAIEQIAAEEDDRALCDRIPSPPLTMEELREFIGEGLAQAEAGNFAAANLDDIRERGRQRLAARGLTPGP